MHTMDMKKHEQIITVAADTKEKQTSAVTEICQKHKNSNLKPSI